MTALKSWQYNAFPFIPLEPVLLSQQAITEAIYCLLGFTSLDEGSSSPVFLKYRTFVPSSFTLQQGGRAFSGR